MRRHAITRDNSQPGVEWSIPYLGLNESDAVAEALDTMTVYTGRPSGHIEFDITQGHRRQLGNVSGGSQCCT